MPSPTDTRAVRTARRHDAPALAQVEARAWRQAYDRLLPPFWLERLSPSRLAQRWHQRIAQGDRILVYEDRQGEAMGYASHGAARSDGLEVGFAGEVYELYVDPHHQRAGVGAALLAHSRAELATRYYWWTIEVLRDNHAARAFYAAMGLETDGRVLFRPIGSLGASGRRYSRPENAVPIVRYEGPLITLGV